MGLLIGTAIIVVVGAFFIFSLPRDGKTAWFVGSEWEGYVVVLVLCVFGIGVMLTITAAMQIFKGVS